MRNKIMSVGLLYKTVFMAPPSTNHKILSCTHNYLLEEPLETEYSEFHILTALGLTLKQAKVYLILVKYGPLRATAISDASGVSRPDVYHAISRLKQLGLIEEILKRPIEYSAVSLNEALSFLLEAKTEQYKKVRAAAQMLIANKSIIKQNGLKRPEMPQFVLVPNGKLVIERIRRAIEQAKLSVDMVLSWKQFAYSAIHGFCESIDSVSAKNMKCRFIIGSPQNNETARQLIEHCRQKLSCQIKVLPHRPKTVFGIYDRKTLFISVFPEKDLEFPALWSNSHSLIAMAEGSFKLMWNKARLLSQHSLKT